MTDVTPPPAAADPPAAPAPAAQTPAVPAATATEVEVVPVKKKSGALGGFALVLSILAILADIIVVIVGVVLLFNAISGFDVSNFDLSGLTPIFAALGIFGGIAIFAFFGGLIVGALALLLGLIAAIKGRGRVAGVFAIIFSILVLVTHGSIALAFAQTGDSISNLTSILPS
jgi:hypothetical protein